MKLLCSFRIDKGELDHISKVQCFTLGIEFMDAWHTVQNFVREEAQRLVEIPVHKLNAKRIYIMAKSYMLTGEVKLLENSQEDWSVIRLERPCLDPQKHVTEGGG